MASTFESQFEPALSVPTPALVVRAEVVRRNIQRMADYARRHSLSVRPHTKTHKSRMLARLQLNAGAMGLTVAKVGEAEQMVQETDDLLMAYPAVDTHRCRRLAQMAQTKKVRVVVDSLTGVERLSAAAGAERSVIGLLVELDVGMGRTGVASAEDALKLAQQIERTPNVRLDGLLCYPGHIWTTGEQQEIQLLAVKEKLSKTLGLWKQHGLNAPIVSGGSTPTAFKSHLISEYTEIRPGTYIFNDMNTVRGEFCSLADCAAQIICTVVSTAVKNQIVIDGGTKTFASDLCIPARESGHGFIVEYPEAKLTRLSEEHGQVDVSQCTQRPKVGDRISVTPNHICPCINLRDNFWWLENDGTLQPINIDARGKLS